MTKFVYGGVSAVALMAALAVPANAADIYRRDAAPSMKDEVRYGPAVWQGLYLGGHAGYAWTDVDIAAVEHFNPDDFIGGGQIGYNFQRGSIVFGPEIDLGYLGMKGDVESQGTQYFSKGGFYGDFTGRLGFSLGNTLLYAKGGAAFVDAKFAAGAVEADDTVWGWTVGGGIEHMIRTDWSLKAEYRHFEFDDVTVGANKFSPTADAATLGINYHVNGGASPLK